MLFAFIAVVIHFSRNIWSGTKAVEGTSHIIILPVITVMNTVVADFTKQDFMKQALLSFANLC